MSIRSTIVRSIDWRDPVVLSLVVLFVVNAMLLSNAVRDGAVADTLMGLAVCSAVGVAIVGVSRGLDSTILGLAFASGITLFAASAFVIVPTSRSGAVAITFGGCSLYYCWRHVRTV